MNCEKTRVGFIFDDAVWLGGVNYFRNLFSAIYSLSDRTIEPIIFTGTRNRAVDEYPSVMAVRTRLLDRASTLTKIARAFVSDSRLLSSLLQNRDVRILSHCAPFTGSSIATIGWIPDFQHVHLKHFFTEEERLSRDKRYADICERCDRIVVSSECALADLRSFAPRFAHKAAVLRFVSSVDETNPVSISELHHLYAFRRPYFLLPNQFWAHKNHRVVVAALRSLRNSGRSITVLATGDTRDYRNPEYFASLMEYVRECNVEDTFRVLGIVPRNHLATLMRHAIALINPSLFEGWSTTVEESKTLGKSMLLSDIPIHREQAPKLGLYFPPDDPDYLAATMWALRQEYDQSRDFERQLVSKVDFLGRQREFGRKYEEIVLSTMAERRQ